MRFKAPYAYQDTEAGRVEVSSRYMITAEGKVGFELGAYDTSRELVIDPILDYSTYLGGTGANQAYEITVDATGAIYLLGKTQSVDFPAGLGSLSGTSDVFVAKLRPDGGGAGDLVFATYLGGSGSEYGSGGIALDGSGNIVILGSTDSSDFATTAGAFDSSLDGSSDAFVAKLNGTGDTLLYSTYYGGGAGESGNDLALDASGDAYITGQTLSNDLDLVNAYDSSFTGSSEAFVAKLTLAGGGGSDLVYATYLGGSADYESGTAIAVDGAGIIHVGAKGLSADHPTTAGAYQTSQSGSSDAILALLDPSLSGSSQLVYATFLGGSGGESINAIHLDGADRLPRRRHELGRTSRNGRSVRDNVRGGSGTCTSRSSNPLGGGASDLVVRRPSRRQRLRDRANAYVDGSGPRLHRRHGRAGARRASPVQRVRGREPATHTWRSSSWPAARARHALGSYLGGADVDYGYGLAVDTSGDIDVAGYTEPDDLATTSGAYSETNAAARGRRTRPWRRSTCPPQLRPSHSTAPARLPLPGRRPARRGHTPWRAAAIGP